MEESKEPREKLSGYLDVWHNYFLPEYGLQCLKIRLWSTSLSLHLKLHSLLALFFVKNHLRIIAQVKIVFQNVKRNAESFPLNLTLSQLQPKSTLFYVTVNFAEPLLLSFHKDVQKYNLFLYSPIRKKKKKQPEMEFHFLKTSIFTTFMTIYKAAVSFLFCQTDFCILDAADLRVHHRKQKSLIISLQGNLLLLKQWLAEQQKTQWETS